MLPFLTRFIILLLAGYGLFRLWRANRSSDGWMNVVITAGFLGRAIVGQVAFWISYLRLPFARELQMGDGLWFFARDALEYFPTASRLARTGVGAILAYPTSGASTAFVKVLATAVYLLGSVTSVAVVLNLFCYLATTAVIVRWSQREPRARLGAALAISAVSLSPAFFLWSLQPLKDTFFQFVVIAFIAACAAWQRIWTASEIRTPVALLVAAAMAVTLMAIAGVRWYFAFALFVAAIIFLLLIASLSTTRKRISFGVAIVLVIVLSRAFLIGGGPYVPTAIIRVMTPSTAIAEVSELPSQIVIRINMARDGFEQAGGRTSIHVGGSMTKLDDALGTKAAPAESTPVSTASTERSLPIHKEGMDTDGGGETQPATSAPVLKSRQEDLKAVVPPAATPVGAAATQTAMTSASETSASDPKHGELPVLPPKHIDIAVQQPKHTDSATHSERSDPAVQQLNHGDATVPQPITTTTKSAASDVKPAPSGPAHAGPPAHAIVEHETPAAQARSRKNDAERKSGLRINDVHAARKPVLTVASPPAPPAVAPPATAVIVPVGVPAAPPERPESATTRLLTGAASVVVPRSIGERLGLFHIGGGQGMFWFTELDTVFFDVIILCALFALAMRRSVSWRNPLVWFLALLTLLAGVPLSYAITNYGTLFRLREMIYIGMALIPLALATSSRRDEINSRDLPAAS
jgi:hypothetical protein